MATKLYYHKTDGGAEYLCTSPVEGTDEGDLYTAVVRLDGEPELIGSLAAPELLEVIKALLIVISQHVADDENLIDCGCIEDVNRARALLKAAGRIKA